MKAFKGYMEAKPLGAAQEKLPIDGYVLDILGAEVENYDWGEVLIFSFDIAEGDWAGYYNDNYEMQQEPKKWKGKYRLSIPKDDGSEKDAFTKRIFKGAMTSIEESNAGYQWNWDEKTLIGKKVGAVFQNREYEVNGFRGFYPACHSFRSVNAIREGNFKIPNDKLLPQKEEEIAIAPGKTDKDMPW